MEQMSGIFLVNKPIKMTTNQLIQKIKRQLGIKKIGHAGTLDPLADGLVIVLVNQGTKLSQFLLNEKKGYHSTLKLFTSTTTGDQEGKLLITQPPHLIDHQKIKMVAKKFNNYQYDQQPPIYSAIKVEGKKLYQYARNDELVNIPTRSVTIHQLKINDYNPQAQTLKFTTLVSKGTYIRALAEDLAKNLGTIGHVIQLTRTQSGNFNLNQAQKWESLKWNDLINLYVALTLSHYPIIELKASLPEVLCGKPILLPQGTPDFVFLANEKKEILAYYGRGEDNFYHCLRGGFTNNKN